jgi:uncharacterized protein
MITLMETPEQIIARTKKWITDVVVGCNFCPFAAKELRQNTIHYQVELATDAETCLETFLSECRRLDEDETIETSLLILPHAFADFHEYLELVAVAEQLIEAEDYEGVYQVASFHPDYCFAGAPEDDAANYTNRSIYPMLHLLREARVEEALEKYPDPEGIPDRNIAFAQAKGLAYMRLLREQCME